MRERAIRFGESAKLVGILTETETETERPPPGAILLNAGILHRVGPSRMNVLIARELAAAGFTSLRFDFSGIGDSEPRPDGLHFDESSVLEVREAMDWLERSRGIGEFILIGLCSGADAAYHTAVADPRVVGLVPIDGNSYRTWRFYVHRYAPRLLRWESWRNVLTGKTYVGPFLRRLLGRAPPGGGSAGGDGSREQAAVFQRPIPPREEMEAWLRALVDRGVEILAIFSGDLDDRYNHRSQFEDAFRGIDFRGRLRVEFFRDADHTFTDLARKRALLSAIAGWARTAWSGAGAPADAGSPASRAA